jgi:predicted CoA-substrate-specific enzyme activase
VAATGRRFRHFVHLTSIPEPEAVEWAYRFVKPDGVDCPAIVSAGGETFMVYALNSQGLISNVLTGNKCASGTGEFFLQQLRRMDVSLDEAAHWTETEKPHPVSGRCSVFCKSDCTHAINKGVPKSRVTAGLCRMMAGKILELLKTVDKQNIMIVGGSSRNQMMIRFLEQEIADLLVPPEAPYFEALGTALWALDHPEAAFLQPDNLFNPKAASFDILPPLRDFEHQVEFKTTDRQTPAPGNICILGLDVGSTTTKAVLMRDSDQSMLASVYLQTDGDPVGSSRKCYHQLLEQVERVMDPGDLSIIGLGVCGSGRQIAGLHALTDGIINEIIAHAAAAVYFDPEVDTIFEIGGQDAKYTYITAGVTSDYAMNEACSAGTGSFLEESAHETLGIRVTDIAEVALRGKYPPNFNDQCAAFISSDIKTAVHEGIEHDDVVAGLVYSICMNYVNRVKGNRPVGRKVFMQGGVCYNRAVPLAMASIAGKPIIVPPEPGLMGAFGAALEIKKRIDMGLMSKGHYDLATLARRAVDYGKSFICKGGKEACDRRCEINVILMDGKKYPFGGACNRYYNLRFNLNYQVESLDKVRTREELIFQKSSKPADSDPGNRYRGTVAFNRSFLINAYYPFYATFFRRIGFSPVLPATVSQTGIDRISAPFCYPAELAHGFFHTLLAEPSRPDFIFLPHIRSIPAGNPKPVPQACPFVQGEPFYLKTTFKKELDSLAQKGTRLLTPLIDMTRDFSDARSAMIQMALGMGVSRHAAQAAFAEAVNTWHQTVREMRTMGRRLLDELSTDPEKIAVVIFGRPYNSMVGEAHMGIPHKIATRGIQVIPFDFLPIDNEQSKEHMFWGMGRLIMQGARFTARHPQLFGTYITNFSCGPDSFLLGYFRDIMGRKPSLTLELDSHTADAGIETRIEAFLDIVRQYRKLLADQKISRRSSSFVPAFTFSNNGVPQVRTSDGRTLSVKDPRVTFLVPSMGRLSSEAMTGVFRHAGYHVAPHPPADEAVLKLGRAHSSCKECLPLILTTGTMLNYVMNKKQPEETVVYLMPTASGPCRFGQYAVFLNDLIRRHEIPDVAVFSLTSDNSYFGMGKGFDYDRAWWAVIISDIMEDIRAMLLTNAADTGHAVQLFEDAWKIIVDALETRSFSDLTVVLGDQMDRLSNVPMLKPAHDVPKILLTGEIFVRKDAFSRRFLTEWLAENGFAAICSPVAEWIHYVDYMIPIDGNWTGMTLKEKLRFHIRRWMMGRYEKRLTETLSRSGLVEAGPVDLKRIIKTASPYLSVNLGGEAVLTIGSSLAEIASEACGVIAIGPFGCMPNRLSESILTQIMTRRDKLKACGPNRRLSEVLSSTDDLPFMAIETDGSPFPQIIHAQLEAFCQRAHRLHQRMTG